MAEGCDVVVYLVREEPRRSATRKRKLCDTHADAQLGKIHADSTTLSRCSKYFDTWIIQRRSMAASAATQMEFWLRAEAEEVPHFHDCFARMHFPFKPFRSVTDCIQVMSVAAQILFEDLLERGVQYLAAVPWSDDDEKQIREFYNSRSFSVPCDDLCARLQVPANEQKRQAELLELTKGALEEYLLMALCPEFKGETRRESRKMFSDALQAIVSDSNPSNCCKLLQHVLRMVTVESSSLLDSIKRRCESSKRRCESSTRGLTHRLSSFCWLVGVAREATIAQEILHLLINSTSISRLLRRAFEDDSVIIPVQIRFARMIYSVFKDVLRGRLLLKSSSQRLDFYHTWDWLLQEIYLVDDDYSVASVVCEFVMTFPVLEQQEIFEYWVKHLGSPFVGGYDLSQAHEMWVERRVARASKRVPESAREDWDSENVSVDAEEDLRARWDSVCLARHEVTPDARILSLVKPANDRFLSPSLDEASPSPRARHEASPSSAARNEASLSETAVSSAPPKTGIDSRHTVSDEEAEEDDEEADEDE